MSKHPDSFDDKREEVMAFRAPESLALWLKRDAERLGLRSTSFLICTVLNRYARKQAGKRLREGAA